MDYAVLSQLELPSFFIASIILISLIGAFLAGSENDKGDLQRFRGQPKSTPWLDWYHGNRPFGSRAASRKSSGVPRLWRIPKPGPV